MVEQGRKEFTRRSVSLDAAAHRPAVLQLRHLEPRLGAFARAAYQAAHPERREAIHRVAQRLRATRRFKGEIE
jgi:hypothetical protein